ncbi:hypothetical protein L211DRAFT_868009 [Terfezia boudieri ATCC MYA-4762]|uniref:Uncharacterized protein n=1 Tax=Terfezia boudieri ATCC MYA-4762 TaxID=1051890 RepID=A0A3N4M1T6_9PEZI|nr:hypothetical protein L211DRAFT_868009 [Terfezia boudieri ATCC MYA-4762]
MSGAPSKAATYLGGEYDEDALSDALSDIVPVLRCVGVSVQPCSCCGKLLRVVKSQLDDDTGMNDSQHPWLRIPGWESLDWRKRLHCCPADGCPGLRFGIMTSERQADSTCLRRHMTRHISLAGQYTIHIPALGIKLCSIWASYAGTKSKDNSNKCS